MVNIGQSHIAVRLLTINIVTRYTVRALKDIGNSLDITAAIFFMGAVELREITKYQSCFFFFKRRRRLGISGVFFVVG